MEATLTATGGAADDRFGYSVALSGDTALVGAYRDDVGTNGDQGSAYIFTRSGSTWTQQAQLTASDGAASDQFGISVALSGNTALVGANGDDVGANSNQGSAYVFTRSGSTWTQQAQLTASDGAASDNFGLSVALSGDTALMGAYFDDIGANVNQGSAYVFTRSGSTWIQQAQLTASDGAASDQFGVSVDLSDDTAVVGAITDDIGANNNQGSAYVFTRSGTTWNQQAQLTASDGAAVDQFGVSVAISGDTVLLGANADNIGASADQGSAYVFVRSGTTWTQQAQLTASDGAANDNLGISVAMSGETAVVGACFDDVGANSNQGSAWVFSRVGTKWIGPDLQLLASDGAATDSFGISVAISGDTAIVGAFSDDVSTNIDQGSAYVFVRSGSIWTQQAKLIASDGAASDFFGVCVALSGDTAIIGADYDDMGANSNQGSAYIFVRSGTIWTQQAKLTGADGAAGDNFGRSVAVFGNTAIVGVPGDDVGSNGGQGSAFVFVRSGTTWTQQAKLTASDGAASDSFGISVALSDSTAIVGAPGDNVGQGSAYIFNRVGTAWLEHSRLTASDGTFDDKFGTSVAIGGVGGDTAVVGAPFDDVGTNANQGSAYVFTHSGTAWNQQAKLTASDGSEFDRFGISAALGAGGGDTALVGAYTDSVRANISQGSAYVFVRSSTIWTQRSQLSASDGAANDSFGVSVALSGETAIVGAFFDGVGLNASQGSSWVFDVAAGDFSFAYNDVTNLWYPSLSAAVLPAASGQQITATQAAWRGVSGLNTFGRSLGLFSSGDLRTPSTSVLDLGGSSALAAATDSSMEIFGQLRSAGFIDLTASSFRLGSRGILTARTGSSLTINAPVADLDGQTRLEQGASMTFSGSVTAIGPTTASANASLTTSGTFTNIDTFTITSGTIASPLFWNRAQANIFGTSAVFGSFTNEAGATTTIRSGTLFVFGSLTNNGAIVGTLCSNCLSTPPNLDVGGDLTLGPAANLNMPFVDSLVYLAGDFNNAINANTRYDLSLATLQLEGTGSEQTLEVMSRDIGANASGLDRTIAGHYPIGTLRIGPSPSTVRLVDRHDNDGLGQGSCEAIYVDTLQIDAGSRLINPTCKIYYNTLINNGTIDVPANVIPLSAPCPADLNNDGFVDDADFSIFVVAYDVLDCADPAMPPSCPADLNADALVDDADFQIFVVAYDAVLCP